MCTFPSPCVGGLAPHACASVLPHSFYIVGSQVLQWLAGKASQHVASGLLLRTSVTYTRGFHLFLAFTIYMGLQCPWDEVAVLSFLEHLIQQGLSAASVSNYISILSHFFALYGWPEAVLHARKTLLLVKAVKMHNPMKPKIKGILSVTMLKELMFHVVKDVNALVFKAIYLLAFFGFFRLASLVPSSAGQFNATRFPLVKDIVWTTDGFQLILKCAKNMQNLDEFKIIHIPKLSCESICPVNAIKRLIKEFKLVGNDPLFMYSVQGEKQILTTFKVRNVLVKAIKSMGLHPKDYGFHCFRSGANLAFEMRIPLEHIKVHGHWKSEAIWSYLKSSSKVSSVVAKTFQRHIL